MRLASRSRSRSHRWLRPRSAAVVAAVAVAGVEAEAVHVRRAEAEAVHARQAEAEAEQGPAAVLISTVTSAPEHVPHPAAAVTGLHPAAVAETTVLVHRAAATAGTTTTTSVAG